MYQLFRRKWNKSKRLRTKLGKYSQSLIFWSHGPWIQYRNRNMSYFSFHFGGLSRHLLLGSRCRTIEVGSCTSQTSGGTRMGGMERRRISLRSGKVWKRGRGGLSVSGFWRELESSRSSMSASWWWTHRYRSHPSFFGAHNAQCNL